MEIKVVVKKVIKKTKRRHINLPVTPKSRTKSRTKKTNNNYLHTKIKSIYDSKLLYYMLLAVFIGLTGNNIYGKIVSLNSIFKKIKDLYPQRADGIIDTISILIKNFRDSSFKLETLSIPFQLYLLKEVLTELFHVGDFTTTHIKNKTITVIINKITKKFMTSMTSNKWDFITSISSEIISSGLVNHLLSIVK